MPMIRQTGRGAHPYSLRNTLQNPLARMLPLLQLQAQVYRLGEKRPPSGHLDGYGPSWEAVNIVLGPQGTQQARVNLQRNFTLLAITCSTTSNVSGGFLAQLYDVKKQVRFADRGVLAAMIGGIGGTAIDDIAAYFLREPYPFEQPDSQVLVQVQNLEAVQNSIELVLYGVALPFNAVRRTAHEFPGGPVSSTSATPKQGGQ
jgi:hypothetical protein